MTTKFFSRSAIAVLVATFALAAHLGLAVSLAGKVTLGDSIKPVSAGRISGVASVADLAQSRTFMVPLKLRNIESLQARVSQGEVISPAEMAEKYYPTEADDLTVRSWLESEGLQITRTDANHLAVFATATLDHIGRSLGTNFARVHTKDGDFVSAVLAPSVPSYIAPLIHGINGLQPHIRFHKHSQVAPVPYPRSLPNGPLSQQTANAPPYLVSEIKKAYSADSVSQTGSSQTIAIVIDAFPLLADLTSFWAINGIPQTTSNITYIPVVDVIGNYPSPTGEETLDTEWTSGVAPAAKVRVYGSKTLDTVSIDSCYLQVLADVPTQPTMHQLSLSFGIGEVDEDSLEPGEIANETSLFTAMAANGITVFASSGDTGSSIAAQAQVSYPASDPNIIAVGGTNLQLRSCTGAVSLEATWNGSGGGVSAHFSRPPWQASLTGISNLPRRFVPDVSAVADPNTGALVVLHGSQAQFGGTSLSAPIWAGFTALINQARSSAALGPVGLLAPKIYPFLGTTAFRDINSGSANGLYSPLNGYDLVTGLGSPSVSVLIAALANGVAPGPNPNPNPNPTPAPPYGTISTPDTTCPLTGTTVTFSWAATPGTAKAYTFTVGDSRVGEPGGYNLFSSGQTGGHTATVRNLPTDGRTLYIRLWSLVNGSWLLPPQDYIYQAAALNAQSPVIAPASGTYHKKVTVNMATGTPGAAIHYTLTGVAPTSASPLFTGAFSLTTSKTVKAIATKSGVPDSPVVTAAYTVLPR